MTIRPTQLRTTEIFVNQINDRRLDLEKVKQQISSGIEVNVASEANGKAGTLLSLQTTLSRIDKHLDRITFSTGLLDHQEAILEQTNNLLIRAQEIANQGANGLTSVEGRAILSQEVFQIRDQLVSLGNTTFQGRYIYGAADDNDSPFEESTYTVPASSANAGAAKRFVFNLSGEDGATTTRNVQVSDTDSVKIVTSGGEVFSSAIGAVEKLGRALVGYRTTTDVGTGLPTGAGTAYTLPADYNEQSNDILVAMTALKNASNNDVIAERTSVGSRIARLEQVSEILNSLKETTESSRAQIQDTDIIEASAKFSNLQTSLEALLASGVQISNISLLNYL